MKFSKIIGKVAAPVVIGTVVGMSVFGSGCTKRVPTELRNKIKVEANMCEKKADSLTKEIKMGNIKDGDVEKNISEKINKARGYVQKVRDANYEGTDTNSLKNDINKAKEQIEFARRDIEASMFLDTGKKTALKGIAQ